MRSPNESVAQDSAYTVLIVTNHCTDQDFYRRCLLTDTTCRYVVLFSEAAFAISICQKQAIDSILVDYTSTTTSDLDILQSLQSLVWEGHPPIVIVASWNNKSASPDVAVRCAVQAIKLGAEDYLLKQSLTPDQLQLAIQSAIENRKLQHTQNQTEIQHTNRDLTHRIAELQTLIELAPVGIAIAFEPSCTQMQCNAYLRQWLGVESGRNISKSAPASEQPAFKVFQNGHEIPPEELPMQMAARLGIDVRDTEIEIRLPDGTTRQLLSYATPLRDEQNQVRGVVGAFLDITERNCMEAELRDREATIRRQFVELEGIYATAPVGLCFQDTNLRYLRINERLAEINGIPASEHLGRTLHEILPELANTIEPLHRHVIDTGKPILDVEIHGKTKAQLNVGRDWIASYYPLKDADGTVLGVNVVVQDITDLKQAQTEREQLLRLLEMERRFLEQILQQLPAGVAIADVPSGKLLFHNDEAIRLLRHPMLTTGTYEGYTHYGALHADGQSYRPEEYPIARSVVQGEVVKAEEMTYRRGDGTKTIFSVSAAPIVDSSGNRIAAVSTFEDISERKQIEADRAQLLAAAEVANRSKDDFVAMVAHELRSPMNSIVGWAKLLQSRHFDASTTQKALDTIVRNTQTQLQLVEDLLDVSRIVHGTLQLTMAPVNLAEIIEAAIETVRPTATAKKLRLKVQLHNVALITGDSHRLQQVVLNLLTNAIKFTFEGGQIDVQLAQTISETRQLVAQLTIRDTGKGISPEFLPHIFERFRQDQHNTTVKQGLGLGLAIVKHLVEMHQGDITAESAGEGQGATFIVRLPILKHATTGELTPPTLPHSIHPSQQPLKDVRVLLVDDEPDILTLATFSLKEYGAVIQTATNVHDALEQILTFQPNILVSDIAMPEQDGYELLERMRSLYPDRQIPAIALTAYAGEARRTTSLQAGFQQHLTKPVEPEQMVKAILYAMSSGGCLV